ncbi:MAG: hypothetical protein ACP5P2_02730 [Candidatus Micrarchaeia archaeon]|jgi:3-hydroxy-3-methylglutaryl CoA synthase
MESGISYIGIEVPPYVVTAEVISNKEGVPKEKITKGLLVNEFRFPGEADTIITLAANNLLSFVENIIKNDLLYEHYKKYRINGIYFATESSTENSRPASMAVLEIVEPIIYERMQNAGEGTREKEVYSMVLNDFRYSDSYEAKFACTAEAKLINLLNQSINGIPRGAIVIGSDTAIYDSSKAKNAEPTQGAASSLVYLTPQPLIAKIEKESVHYNFPAYDFYKPDEHTPRVPSGYGSEVDYVVTIGSAFEEYERLYGLPEEYYIVSHVPFSKEAIYLASFLYTHHLRVSGRIHELEKEIGKEPLGSSRSEIELIRLVSSKYQEEGNQEEIIEYIAKSPEIKALWEYHKKVRETTGFKKFIEEKGVLYAILLPSQIGNSYNNSIVVATASLLLNAPKYKPIIWASYGSGSGTTINKLIPVERSREEMASLINIKSLERRIELSEKEYEKLHEKLIEDTEYKRGLEALRRGTTLKENDKRTLGPKYNEDGFKLVSINENGIGSYTYNGKKIKKMPIIK